MPIGRQILTSGVLIGVGMSASCHAQEPELRAVPFGPASAEAEIRAALQIRGDLPNIRMLIRWANSQGIAHEAPQDRSLRYCGAGRNIENLGLEMFYVRVDRQRRIGYYYLAAYNEEGVVVCIETRHAYTSV